MSKIEDELNAEMMHPKVINEQRKALFAEMVRKTGSHQSVLDRLLQEIQFLRDHEGGPMDEEAIDILRGKVAELERRRDELLAVLEDVRKCKSLYSMWRGRNKSKTYGAIIDAAIAAARKEQK